MSDETTIVASLRTDGVGGQCDALDDAVRIESPSGSGRAARPGRPRSRWPPRSAACPCRLSLPHSTHFSPVGKAPPPRPRRPESVTARMTWSGVMVGHGSPPGGPGAERSRRQRGRLARRTGRRRLHGRAGSTASPGASGAVPWVRPPRPGATCARSAAEMLIASSDAAARQDLAVHLHAWRAAGRTAAVGLLEAHCAVRADAPNVRAEVLAEGGQHASAAEHRAGRAAAHADDVARRSARSAGADTTWRCRTAR